MTRWSSALPVPARMNLPTPTRWWEANTSGVTTFSTPIVLAVGAGSYNVPVNGANAWGNYSSTVVDPNAELFGQSTGKSVFWTFQEFASAFNVWSVEEMAEIVVNTPQATPGVSLGIASNSIGENGFIDLVTASLAAPSTRQRRSHSQLRRDVPKTTSTRPAARPFSSQPAKSAARSLSPGWRSTPSERRPSP